MRSPLVDVEFSCVDLPSARVAARYRDASRRSGAIDMIVWPGQIISPRVALLSAPVGSSSGAVELRVGCNGSRSTRVETLSTSDCGIFDCAYDASLNKNSGFEHETLLSLHVAARTERHIIRSQLKNCRFAHSALTNSASVFAREGQNYGLVPRNTAALCISYRSGSPNEPSFTNNFILPLPITLHVGPEMM